MTRLRAEARRCRREAAQTTVPEARKEWAELAAQYDQLAESFDGKGPARTQV